MTHEEDLKEANAFYREALQFPLPSLLMCQHLHCLFFLFQQAICHCAGNKIRKAEKYDQTLRASEMSNSIRPGKKAYQEMTRSLFE